MQPHEGVRTIDEKGVGVCVLQGMRLCWIKVLLSGRTDAQPRQADCGRQQELEPQQTARGLKQPINGLGWDKRDKRKEYPASSS